MERNASAEEDLPILRHERNDGRTKTVRKEIEFGLRIVPRAFANGLRWNHYQGIDVDKRKTVH